MESNFSKIQKSPEEGPETGIYYNNNYITLMYYPDLPLPDERLRTPIILATATCMNYEETH